MIATEKVGRFRFANHSAAPSGRSRQAASPAKPAAVIAGALADVRGLLATACGFLIFFLVYGVFA